MFNILFLISAIIFVSIDFIYLHGMQNYFKNQVQKVQSSELKMNLFGAALCYIFLIFGLNYFIIEQKKGIADAFILGLIIYGVYETTNYSLFSRWSFLTVILDTLWGGILFALTTFCIIKIRSLGFH